MQKKTILVIDDEKIVRDISTKLLNRLGFDVITAAEGHAALRFYRENHKRVLLVLLDVMMPGSDSGDIVDGLQQINPDVRVLLFSGYPEDDVVSALLAEGCAGFLQKPFNLTRLSAEINAVMQT